MTDSSNETTGNPESDHRTFLVVIDDTSEMELALHFACRRALKSKGRVALLYVQEPPAFHHWLGVEQLAREEQRETGEALMNHYAAEVMRITGERPILYLREGDRVEALFNLLETNEISLVTLATSVDTSRPGPIISYAMSKGLARLKVPVTIIPGTLTLEDIFRLS